MRIVTTTHQAAAIYAINQAALASGTACGIWAGDADCTEASESKHASGVKAKVDQQDH